MNRLIEVMAEDMGINPYYQEQEEYFEFRVVFSALGLWCLKSALGEKENNKGISKNAQSILLHSLLEKYADICPQIRTHLFASRNADIAVFIRNIYEQTGYLNTLENNNNILNNSGEVVKFSDTNCLCLGIPDQGYRVNGLGIHIERGEVEIQLNDFLIRDNLTPEEYLKVNFDECDFDVRDIETDTLEFFNPHHYGSLSSSWNRLMNSDITMARKSTTGPYYRVIRKEDGTILYSDDNCIDNHDDLTGAEYRRIYVALKRYYDNPMQIIVCPIDEEYSYIRILGQLPNREYYYLLMNAWPKNNFLDRNNFIIRSDLTEKVKEVLGAIGFSSRIGEFYG